MQGRTGTVFSFHSIVVVKDHDLSGRENTNSIATEPNRAEPSEPSRAERFNICLFAPPRVAFILTRPTLFPPRAMQPPPPQRQQSLLQQQHQLALLRPSALALRRGCGCRGMRLDCAGASLQTLKNAGRTKSRGLVLSVWFFVSSFLLCKVDPLPRPSLCIPT